VHSIFSPFSGRVSFFCLAENIHMTFFYGDGNSACVATHGSPDSDCESVCVSVFRLKWQDDGLWALLHYSNASWPERQPKFWTGREWDGQKVK